jgi:hypothetical protein
MTKQSSQRNPISAGTISRGNTAVKKPQPEDAMITRQTSTPDNESFDEVPTVANRPLPRPAGASEAPPAEKTPGAYRMVRPATSDKVDLPARKTKGVAIGLARK